MALAYTHRLLQDIGDRAICMVLYMNKVATLIGYGVSRLTVGIGSLSRVGRDVLLKQILFTGVEALRFTTLIALLMGLIVAVQTQLIGAFADQDFTGQVLVVVLVRELGPLMTALIVLGRSGTAIAAELGNMRVAGEIDSLEQMGVDPFDYLVVPRLGGAMVALFCVSLYFVIVSLAVGFEFSRFVDPGMTLNIFLDMIARNLAFVDVFTFVAKTVVPGLMIAAINCNEGLSAGPESTDVPRATTRGVVYSISAVFLWNALVTALVTLA